MSNKVDKLRAGFYQPGRSKGLLDLFKHSYLLSLLRKKEVKVRYRGSFLGLIWTYIKPLTTFFIYYYFVGRIMGADRANEHYAIYLFSGLISIQFFNETFRNCTKSIRDNAALVRKIYLPRELFPIATWRVAITHFYPQLFILLVASIIQGWYPGFLHILAVLLGFILLSGLAIGAGMLFAAMNVFYRDAENLVELITMITTWFSPILYKWSMIEQHMPLWLFKVYMCNPLTCAAELFHYAFWWPTNIDFTNYGLSLPPHFGFDICISIIIVILMMVIGQLAFRKFEGRFAQEL
ncbi:MAG: ABC transporter permease [Bifidobacteriaceae bacterium]|jgi:ABC-2 type transport system permease protein|nr:ABC transporter permease [Bifidobacteriaceae bacterium]